MGVVANLAVVEGILAAGTGREEGPEAVHSSVAQAGGQVAGHSSVVGVLVAAGSLVVPDSSLVADMELESKSDG